MSRRAKRILALPNDPQNRARLVAGVYRLDQAGSPRVGGGDQEMKVQKEMNELRKSDIEALTRTVE